MPDGRSEAVSDAVAELVHQRGCDLEEVDIAATGARRAVTVTVDRDGGVPLDTLADLTREISARLDADDPLGDHAYTLEVTTPGIDRPLTAPRHWRRARGRMAAVTLAGGEQIHARVGALSSEPDSEAASHSAAAPDTAVDLIVRGRSGPTVRRESLADVSAAVVEVEFKPASAEELALCGVDSSAVSGADGSDVPGADGSDLSGADGSDVSGADVAAVSATEEGA